MRNVILLIGLPASGKSTWAKEQIKKEPSRWKRFNRDDLRAMINDSHYDRKNEEFIRNAQEQLLRTALVEGYDCIVDNTSLIPQTVKKLHKVCESVGDVKVIHKAFPVDIEECIRRNNLREGKTKVPEKVIRDMAKGAGLDRGRKLEDKEVYYPPHNFQIVEQDESLDKILIVDLDGTCSLLNGRNPYDASTCYNDLPNKPVISCIKAMYSAGCGLVFMSGREDKYREPTERFLKEHVDLPYQLYMRATGDMRKDSIIKNELFNTHIANKYYVEFILDDRTQVVSQYRSMGLTCFQVAPGDF